MEYKEQTSCSNRTTMISESQASDSNPIDLSVVSPCLNEEGNILELVRRVSAVFDRKKIAGELILVDDGSTDQTYATIQALMCRYPALRVERHSSNRGIEAGWKTGVSAARGKFVCLMDADLQNPPEQIWNLYQEIIFSNADLVQGFRSSVGRLRDSRFLLSRGLNVILNSCFGMSLRDNKSGFVMAPKEVLADILRHRSRYYYFQSFIAVSAASKGYTIREVETLFESRFAGTSFISGNPTKFVIRTLIDVCKGLLEFRLRTKRDNALGEFLKDHQPNRADAPLPLARHLLFEAYFHCIRFFGKRLSRRTKLYYEELKKSQWLSPADVRSLQEMKLRGLMAHAFRHVPYYRDKMESVGLNAEDIVTIDDLSKLPLLSQDDVKSNIYFNLLSNNHNKRQILRIASTGHTGSPFSFFADKHRLEIQLATKLRGLEWAGYRFGDRKIRLHPRVISNRLEALAERFEAFVSRGKLIPACRFTATTRNEIERSLKTKGFILLEGSAEMAKMLSESVNDEKGLGRVPGALVVSGQTLSAEDRARIEQSLGSKIFASYGTREFPTVAFECERHAGVHVSAESFIVEILKDGQPVLPGEMGEIVVTDLNNYCMPLIRYKTGDFAIAEKSHERCSCGRGLPRLMSIVGREPTVLHAGDGIQIPADFFAELCKEYDYLVDQYQVVEGGERGITIRIKKAARFSEAEFDRMLSTMRQHLGADVLTRIEMVDSIDTSSPTQLNQTTTSALGEGESRMVYKYEGQSISE